ncbi:deacetylase SIR2, partial [Streptococcus agalactiae]|nr:deacetylase SIR2 [Streptococcus agalactiae]MCK6348879.1 deacetylase SIR2 [Streptococcus agalactiae]
DNAFAVTDYNLEKVFHIQGEYGLWQCSQHCHQQTYRNDQAIRQMIAQQKDMKIPSNLIPKCPKCDQPFEINKRNEEKGMVEDADFHAQRQRYENFLSQHQNDKVLYLEIGVGHTTPQFIKHPFWRFVSLNENSLFVTLNHKHYRIPQKIRSRSVQLTQHIAELIAEAKKEIIG